MWKWVGSLKITMACAILLKPYAVRRINATASTKKNYSPMHLDPETHQMTAIVLAGDRTKSDSLINHTEAGSKAMIDLDGTPMVRRVLNSLRQSRVVNRICLTGPEASEVATDAALQEWVHKGEINWSAPGDSPSTSAYRT